MHEATLIMNASVPGKSNQTLFLSLPGHHLVMGGMGGTLESGLDDGEPGLAMAGRLRVLSLARARPAVVLVVAGL